MNDFLTEVDDVMRQERIAKLWQQYKRPFIATVSGVILMTAAISGFKSWNNHVRTTQTSIVLEIMGDQNFPYNIKDETPDIRGSLKALLLMRAAGEALVQDDPEAALGFYQKLADDNSISTNKQYPALLMIARMSPEKDTLQILKPVLKDKKSAWHPPALIEAALHYARKEDYISALTLLNQLQEMTGLPGSLYEKAQALSHIYTIKSADTK